MRIFGNKEAHVYVVGLRVYLYLLLLVEFIRGVIRYSYMYSQILVENAPKFADWWRTSVVGTGISLLVCPFLLVEFYHHATMAGPYRVLFSWLALAMVIGTAVCFLALIKAAKTASHSACRVPD